MYYSKLTDKEVIIVNSEVKRLGKNLVISMLLNLFLGSSGVHRLYLGKYITGVTMLVLTVIGSFTTFLLVGYIPLAITFVWAFVDLFLESNMVVEANSKIQEAASKRILNERHI